MRWREKKKRITMTKKNYSNINNNCFWYAKGNFKYLYTQFASFIHIFATECSVLGFMFYFKIKSINCTVHIASCRHRPNAIAIYRNGNCAQSLVCSIWIFSSLNSLSILYVLYGRSQKDGKKNSITDWFRGQYGHCINALWFAATCITDWNE